ncbi:MAG: penicillin-binding protein 1A [Wenzhouxiangellaceae bacterium]
MAATWWWLAPTLPDVAVLREVKLQTPLNVFSADLQRIAVFGEKRRIPASLEEMPESLRHAFIAGEDDRFYEHPGIDYQGIMRAAWNLILTGEKEQGGSTITMQLARNFFLSAEKSYIRKLREIMLAIKIERELSKDAILELYLNKIYLGHRAYGVAAAAQVYYGRPLGELTLGQMAMIAALPKAPSRVNPITNPERATTRRNYVLGRMLELGYIDQKAHDEARAEPGEAYYHGADVDLEAAYVAEMARREALDRFGDDAYEGGYRFITSLRSDRQRSAIEAVREGLRAYDERHGYRGPEAKIDLTAESTPEEWNEALSNYRTIARLTPGLVISSDADLAMIYLADGQSIGLDLKAIEWARPYVSEDRVGDQPTAVNEVLQTGDIIRLERDGEGNWRLTQLPQAQAALVSLDPYSGEIHALVGGIDFALSKFNRVTQSRRQPGSSFKPFVYAAAIDRGYTPATVVNDAPVVYQDAGLEGAWKPQNFSEQFYGPTRLREAMVNSRNLVSVRILQDIGMDYAREYIQRFGFSAEELPPNLSMALGSATLTPLSMARAYAVFASGGHLPPARWLLRIENSDGQVLWEAPPVSYCDPCLEPPEQTIAEATVQQATPTLRDPEEADELPDDTARPSDLAANLPLVQSSFIGPPEPVRAPKVIAEQTAYLVRSMMMDVVRRGTGRAAMELGRQDLAGKTGTTNDQHDAWFSGYNNELVTSVWVGFDDYRTLGRRELGGRAALPIWVDYNANALAGVAEDQLVMPVGLTRVWVDAETGELSSPGRAGAISEIMRSSDAQRLAANQNQDVTEDDDAVSTDDIF